MDYEPKEVPAKKADQYVIRFYEAGHRQRLKAQAKVEKRSFNSYLLILLEAGEHATKPTQGAHQ